MALVFAAAVAPSHQQVGAIVVGRGTRAGAGWAHHGGARFLTGGPPWAQVEHWVKHEPSESPPPHVVEAASHEEEPFQGWHVEKVGDIKEKMKDIAEAQTHIEDILDRIGERRERTVVHETVGVTLDRHAELERQYLAEESERRIRAIMEGRTPTPQSYSVDDVVEHVAPTPKALPLEEALAKGDPEEIEKAIVAEHAARVKAAEERYEREKTPETKAALDEARLPPSRVPVQEAALKAAKTPEAKAEAERKLEAARLEAAKLEAAKEAEEELVLAKKSGDPKLIQAAAEKVAAAAAALHPAKEMPQTLVRELERIRWLVREQKDESRKEEAKKEVEALVKKAVEKREEQKKKIAQVVQQRRKLIESLRTRQHEAQAMKAKAAEMMKQARAAKLLAEAKLTQAKSEGQQMVDMNNKLTEVTTQMAKMREQQNLDVKRLLDIQPEF